MRKWTFTGLAIDFLTIFAVFTIAFAVLAPRGDWCAAEWPDHTTKFNAKGDCLVMIDGLWVADSMIPR